MRHTLRVLAICTRGGVLVPTLKDLTNRLRNEQIRRACRGGADCAAIARRRPVQIWLTRRRPRYAPTPKKR